MHARVTHLVDLRYRYGDQKYQPSRKALPETRNTEQNKTVIHHRNEHDAQHRSVDGTATATDHCSPEDGSSDNVELTANEIKRVGVANVGAVNDSGYSGQETDIYIDKKLNLFDAESRAFGCLAIATEGKDATTDHRVSQDDGSENRQEYVDKKRHMETGRLAGIHRLAEYLKATVIEHRLGETVDNSRIDKGEDKPLESAQGPETDDERRQPERRDYQRVDQPEKGTNAERDEEGDDDRTAKLDRLEKLAGNVHRDHADRRKGDIDTTGNQNQENAEGKNTGDHIGFEQSEQVSDREEAGVHESDDERHPNEDEGNIKLMQLK